jgi:hypothetical protein
MQHLNREEGMLADELRHSESVVKLIVVDIDVVIGIGTFFTMRAVWTMRFSSPKFARAQN